MSDLRHPIYYLKQGKEKSFIHPTIYVHKKFRSDTISSMMLSLESSELRSEFIVRVQTKVHPVGRRGNYEIKSRARSVVLHKLRSNIHCQY